MYFDVNKPMREDQLASLYNNPQLSPEQVDTNMFFDASQGRNYVHDQAANLGIDNPVAYYSNLQTQAKLKNTPSGFDQELARLSGNFDPRSLPGQLKARDASVNLLMAAQASEAQKLAALQNQQRMSQYKLPGQDEAMPTLSPVMQEAMRQQGVTNPIEFLMRQRLDGMATPSVASGEAIPKQVALPSGWTGAIPAGRMYNLPEMQTAMKDRPELASTLFQATTDQQLGPYAAARVKAAEGQRIAGVASLRRAHENGEIGYDEQGRLRWRKSVANPQTGKMEATGPLGEGDPYQKSLEQYLPDMDSSLARFQDLAKNRAPALAGGGAPAAITPVSRAESMPPWMQATDASSNLISNWGGSMYGELGANIKSMFSGTVPDPHALFRQNAQAPAGRAAIHALPLLAKNPRFQQIMRENPEKARRIIEAIQRGAPAQSPVMPSPDQFSDMPMQ